MWFIFSNSVCCLLSNILQVESMFLTTSTRSTKTRSLQSQTATMEVHHHSNTQPKKRFRHYLWEFLMLFLAVFAGFLAENQREHYVEHQREQQYMRSMIKDLEQD